MTQLPNTAHKNTLRFPLRTASIISCNPLRQNRLPCRTSCELPTGMRLRSPASFLRSSIWAAKEPFSLRTYSHARRFSFLSNTFLSPLSLKKIIRAFSFPDESFHVFDFLCHNHCGKRFQCRSVISSAGGWGCPVIENAYHTSIRLCADRPPESLPEFHLHAWYHNSLDIF